MKSIKNQSGKKLRGVREEVASETTSKLNVLPFAWTVTRSRRRTRSSPYFKPDMHAVRVLVFACSALEPSVTVRLWYTHLYACACSINLHYNLFCFPFSPAVCVWVSQTRKQIKSWSSSELCGYTGDKVHERKRPPDLLRPFHVPPFIVIL